MVGNKKSHPVEPAEPLVPRYRVIRRLWRAETFYVTFLAAFGIIAVLAYYNAYFGWDLRAARSVQAISIPGTYTLMWATSLVGNGWTPYALTGLSCLVFLLVGKPLEAAGLLLSAGGSGLVNGVLKALIGRPRPADDLVNVFSALGSRSFPSGHVTFYVCYFGFLFFLSFVLLPRGSIARRVALSLTAMMIVLVGFSRVYLGAHWPSDTLGAYLFGGLWLAFSLDMYRRWKEKSAARRATQSAPGV